MPVAVYSVPGRIESVTVKSRRESSAYCTANSIIGGRTVDRTEDLCEKIFVSVSIPDEAIKQQPVREPGEPRIAEAGIDVVARHRRSGSSIAPSAN